MIVLSATLLPPKVKKGKIISIGKITKRLKNIIIVKVT